MFSPSQASLAAGRQSSNQNGTSSTQSGPSQTTVCFYLDAFTKNVHVIITSISCTAYDILFLHVTTFRLLMSQLVSLLFPQINLTTSPAAAQLISRAQSVNSAPSGISQQAVLLGNTSSSTLTASQAQMYLRAQMVSTPVYSQTQEFFIFVKILIYARNKLDEFS